MKKLIEVSKNVIGNSEVSAVSARELYLGLGLDKSNWAKWATLNIEQNEFFLQGVDFVQLVLSTSANTPNPPKNVLYWSPTDKASGLFELFDTPKKHNDDTPIKQIKWFESVIELITV